MKRKGMLLLAILSAALLAAPPAPGQVTVAGTLTPLQGASQLIGGAHPGLVTVSTDADPTLRVPVYGARIPVGVPIRFHISAVPAGVSGIHYSLQSVGGTATSTVPNHKQEFVPPVLSSDPFTLTAPGPDAAIVWYPHQDDPNTIGAASQLSATQQRLPFLAIDSQAPNGAVRSGPNSFELRCNPWKLDATITATDYPFTFGIRNVLCLFSQATGGTGVSCAVESVECFSPPTLIVP